MSNKNGDDDVARSYGPALDVRARWIEAMKRSEETAGGGAIDCPVCFRKPQLRAHTFTATMALALIHLYHRGGPAAADTIPALVTTGESLKKLVLWGLALYEGGAYQLSPEGEEVVQKRATVARYCMAVNGYPAWFSGERAWIDETLNQRYSYEDLMP